MKLLRCFMPFLGVHLCFLVPCVNAQGAASTHSANRRAQRCTTDGVPGAGDRGRHRIKGLEE